MGQRGAARWRAALTRALRSGGAEEPLLRGAWRSGGAEEPPSLAPEDQEVLKSCHFGSSRGAEEVHCSSRGPEEAADQKGLSCAAADSVRPKGSRGTKGLLLPRLMRAPRTSRCLRSWSLEDQVGPEYWLLPLRLMRAWRSRGGENLLPPQLRRGRRVCQLPQLKRGRRSGGPEEEPLRPPKRVWIYAFYFVFIKEEDDDCN